ncbi:MAG TPA: DUF4926 domain-containing protein [Blastocatellia bacterium]|nr:DUF4926 domain-containing protein [Blastocatellia bacterium]
MIATRKAHILDVVELLEDLPEYGVRRGERGAVVEVFDEPEEAYMVEFVDPSGASSRIADWVRPAQIKTLEEIAKETFEQGIQLQNEGKPLEAERKFRQAISLKPSYIGVLHNSIVRSFEGSDEWQKAITAMQLVFRINSDYEIARRNLAIAYQKYGIQKANEGDAEGAIEIFQLALSVGPPEEIISDIKNSIAAVFTTLGIREYESGQLWDALRLMRQANMVDPNEKTRRNLGIAYAHLAQSYLNKGDFQNAILAFERAEHAGLSSAELLNDYGVALAMLQRFDEAILVFERGLEMGPENKTIKANLDLAKKDATTDYNAEGINFSFNPALLMQPQEYRLAA